MPPWRKCRYIFALFLSLLKHVFTSITLSYNRCAELFHFLSFQKENKIVLSFLWVLCFQRPQETPSLICKAAPLVYQCGKLSPSRINVRRVRWETFIADYYFGLIFFYANKLNSIFRHWCQFADKWQTQFNLLNTLCAICYSTTGDSNSCPHPNPSTDDRPPISGVNHLRRERERASVLEYIYTSLLSRSCRGNPAAREARFTGLCSHLAHLWYYEKLRSYSCVCVCYIKPCAIWCNPFC